MTGGFSRREPKKHTLLDKIYFFFAPHQFELEQMRAERNAAKCEADRWNTRAHETLEIAMQKDLQVIQLTNEIKEFDELDVVMVHQRNADLQEKVTRLTAAIVKHRAATGHEMCWENDEELWTILGDGIVIEHPAPPFDEFMHRCKLYRESKDKK